MDKVDTCHQSWHKLFEAGSGMSNMKLEVEFPTYFTKNQSLIKVTVLE